jgi:hypothetical protein
MTIGTTDVFLLVAIVASLIVGFFWGAARSLMLLAAWLIAFLAGAYLKLELGSYLARQWDNFPAAYSEMAAFGLIYALIGIAAPFAVVLSTRGSQKVSRYQVLDDLVGAFFATFVAVLGLAGLMIIFATFYEVESGIVHAQGGPEWSSSLYQSLINSNIGEGIADELIPILGTVLGPILPPDVREVMV